MSSKRWNKDEKAELVKLYSSGKSLGEIAQKLDRSESAIRLRLQSLVYDGIAKGVKLSDLEATLGTDSQTITQMFYAHREFKEGRREEVVSLDEISKVLTGDTKRKSSKKANVSKKQIQDSLDSLDSLIDDGSSVKATKSSKVSPPNNRSQSSEIDKLVEQNRIMEAIINNRELKKKIKKLYKEGKLVPEEKRVLERIFID